MIARQLYGDNHRSIAIAHHHLGSTYYPLGDAKSARDSFRNALEMFLKLPHKKEKNEIDFLGRLYHNLGNVERQLGNAEQGLKLQQKGLKIFLKIYEEEHQEVATFYNNLGLCAKQVGKIEDAIGYFSKCYELRKKILGEEHIQTVIPARHLGLLLLETKPEEAVKLLQQTVTVYLKHYGPNHIDLAYLYNSLGVTHLHLQEPQNAITNVLKGLDIGLRTLGESHEFVGNCYHNLGTAYYKLRKKSDAKNCIKKAIAIFKVVDPRRIPELNLCLNLCR